MTKEEIAQGVISNRYPKSEEEKIGDAELYYYIVDAIDQYAQSIVLGKLPGDDEMHKPNIGTSYDSGFLNGATYMRSIATQSILTEDEVTKPYRELLEGLIPLLNQDGMDEEYKNAFVDIALQRINQLMKP